MQSMTYFVSIHSERAHVVETSKKDRECQDKYLNIVARFPVECFPESFQFGSCLVMLRLSLYKKLDFFVVNALPDLLLTQPLTSRVVISSSSMLGAPCM